MLKSVLSPIFSPLFGPVLLGGDVADDEVPENALLDDDGNPILDENGDYILIEG